MLSLTLAAPDLGGWFHTLDPYLVRFTEGFGIRWYGAAYVAGFAIGWWILRALARRRLVCIPPERIADAALVMILGIVVGGRLGYVLFYQPGMLWEFSREFPWWAVLAINRGGMASHGGMIGVVIASIVIGRGFKNERGEREGRCPPLHVADGLALVSPFGLMLGRIANFINGELLGRIVAMPGERAPWWAVRFPQEVLTEHAPPLTEAQRLALEQIVSDHRLPSQLWEQGYEGVLRAVQRGAPGLQARLEPLISARAPSQLVQALAEGVGVGLVVWWVFRKPRLPGVVGCWFFISYGALRIATEFVRLPDAHLGRTLGLSRGQWLSVLMIVVAVVLLAVITRRGGRKYGGWLTGPPEPACPS